MLHSNAITKCLCCNVLKDFMFCIQETRNPLSRSMRMGRLAQQHVALKTVTNMLKESNMLEESYDAANQLIQV